MPIRAPVAGVNISETKSDHEKHDRQLNHHDGCIEPRTFLDADRQNRCNHERDHESRQIETDLDAKNLRCSQQIMCALY